MNFIEKKQSLLSALAQVMKTPAQLRSMRLNLKSHPLFRTLRFTVHGQVDDHQKNPET